MKVKQNVEMGQKKTKCCGRKKWLGLLGLFVLLVLLGLLGLFVLIELIGALQNSIRVNRVSFEWTCLVVCFKVVLKVVFK